MSDQADISSTLHTISVLLDELRSIDNTDVLSTLYHPTLEAAYVALGIVETEIDALGQELEFQHQRLDEQGMPFWQRMNRLTQPFDLPKMRGMGQRTER